MKLTTRRTIGGDQAGRDGFAWQRRRGPTGEEEWHAGHCLIIVSRDRPELFAELSERHGQQMKVILDRRREPRPPLVHETTQLLEMARNGFIMVSAK